MQLVLAIGNIISAIAAAIHFAEMFFPKGTGSQKMQHVLETADTLIDAMPELGEHAQALKDAAAPIAQNIVDVMKGRENFASSASAIAAAIPGALAQAENVVNLVRPKVSAFVDSLKASTLTDAIAQSADALNKGEIDAEQHARNVRDAHDALGQSSAGSAD